MQIFDTHTHEYFDAFDADRNEMMEKHFSSGICGKIQIGCDEKTSKSALELAKTHEKMFCSVGVHPCHVDDFENFETEFPKLMNIFEEMIEKNPQKIVGIGETGFDFYHLDFPELRAKQEKSFLEHILLAQKHQKTLIIHTRNAKNETIDFLRLVRKTHQFNKNFPKTVVHCFSEDVEAAEIFTQEMGFFLGIGGILTYKKNDAFRETIKKIPLEFLVTETDSPYLAPQKHRGNRNESIFLDEVVETIANLKNLSTEKTAEILVQNAQELFSLPFSHLKMKI